jgi:hypothetical protein
MSSANTPPSYCYLIFTRDGSGWRVSKIFFRKREFLAAAVAMQSSGAEFRKMQFVRDDKKSKKVRRRAGGN